MRRRVVNSPKRPASCRPTYTSSSWPATAHRTATPACGWSPWPTWRWHRSCRHRARVRTPLEPNGARWPTCWSAAAGWPSTTHRSSATASSAPDRSSSTRRWRLPSARRNSPSPNCVGCTSRLGGRDRRAELPPQAHQDAGLPATNRSDHHARRGPPRAAVPPRQHQPVASAAAACRLGLASGHRRIAPRWFSISNSPNDGGTTRRGWSVVHAGVASDKGAADRPPPKRSPRRSNALAHNLAHKLLPAPASRAQFGASDAQ